MTRLIDADALMEAMKKEYKRVYCPWHFETYKDIVNSITNAPTVEREGWVSVPIEKELASIVFTAMDENGLVDPDWVDAKSISENIAKRIIHYSKLPAAPKE